ncbi:NEDD4 family-interacting protein 1 isoform X2 [Bactrocera dorsalis]|uniref:NEDD4 family-interacting protein 1 isoform X2 n=1 Tax=Bactrocera dorsalis TaxID=27457 RepID=A0A8N4QGV9_BACDO|nr:NEDD4 family-interacting protein 1 isoform X2 [Bactrocera dorsalis]
MQTHFQLHYANVHLTYATEMGNMPDNQQTPAAASQGEELGPPKADFSAPPPYELVNNNVCGMPQQQQQQNATIQLQQQQQLPPPYLQVSLPPLDSSLAQPPPPPPPPGGVLMSGDMPKMQSDVKLPSYEEVQRQKSANGELPFMNSHVLPPHLHDSNTPTNGGGNNNNSNGTAPALTFIAIDASDAENLTSNNDNSVLGTDAMFILAFMVAFLFNWIGFLMLTCFCQTIAARYGALSGFGLSLAKWTLIVKNSTELASHENSWLWWLTMAFGFLICIRAFLQYISIKRTWRLLSTSAQERLLFFY